VVPLGGKSWGDEGGRAAGEDHLTFIVCFWIGGDVDQRSQGFPTEIPENMSDGAYDTSPAFPGSQEREEDTKIGAGVVPGTAVGRHAGAVTLNPAQ